MEINMYLWSFNRSSPLGIRKRFQNRIFPIKTVEWSAKNQNSFGFNYHSIRPVYLLKISYFHLSAWHTILFDCIDINLSSMNNENITEYLWRVFSSIQGQQTNSNPKIHYS